MADVHSEPHVSPARGPSLPSMLAPLEELVGKVKHLHGQKLIYRNHLTDPHYLHRFHFLGPEGGGSYQRLGLFAGIHGDEVAGSLAAVRFLTELVERPELAQGYEFFVYPVCNPTGYADGTRHSRSGLDLNREFWKNSEQLEVQLLEKEILQLNFAGFLSLNADDTSDGLYGFALGIRTPSTFFLQRLKSPLVFFRETVAAGSITFLHGTASSASVTLGCSVLNPMLDPSLLKLF